MNKNLEEKILTTTSIDELVELLNESKPGLLTYINLWDKEILKKVLKKFNMTLHEFESKVMSPLSPIDDFNPDEM